jgi:hypothetical protein
VMLDDLHGRLWLGSDRGLSLPVRRSPSNRLEVIHTYTVKDGLRDDRIERCRSPQMDPTPHERDWLELLTADISHSNYFFIAAMASIASSRRRRSSALRSPCISGSCLAPSAARIKTWTSCSTLSPRGGPPIAPIF